MLEKLLLLSADERNQLLISNSLTKIQYPYGKHFSNTSAAAQDYLNFSSSITDKKEEEEDRFFNFEEYVFISHSHKINN